LTPAVAAPSGLLTRTGATLGLSSQHGVQSVDAVYLLVIVVLAAVTAGLVHACERLRRGSARK
jgi:hypothetical protein